MIAAIIVGTLSGMAAFTASMLIFMKIMARNAGARDWLEPYWKVSNRNSTDQAAYLERIAHVLEQGR